jgi:hypothetical protein
MDLKQLQDFKIFSSELYCVYGVWRILLEEDFNPAAMCIVHLSKKGHEKLLHRKIPIEYWLSATGSSLEEALQNCSSFLPF